MAIYDTIKNPASMPPSREHYITNNQGDNPMNTVNNRDIDDTIKALKVASTLYKNNIDIKEARGFDLESISGLFSGLFNKRKTAVMEFNQLLDQLEAINEDQEPVEEFNEELDDYENFSYNVDTLGNVMLYDNYESKSVYLQGLDAKDFIAQLDKTNSPEDEYDLIASYKNIMESITIDAICEHIEKY